MRADDPFWKDFVSKPALKYILRALTGLATKHSPTQMALAKGTLLLAFFGGVFDYILAIFYRLYSNTSPNGTSIDG